MKITGLFGTKAVRDLNTPLGKKSPYFITPSKADGADNARFFYLSETTLFDLRWSWCDEIPGEWDCIRMPPKVEHKGWYCDSHQMETIRGVVFKLPRDRGFLAGWSMGESMAGSLETCIYGDIASAGRAADGMAEMAAEKERRYQQKYEAEQKIEELRGEIALSRSDFYALKAETIQKNKAIDLPPLICNVVRAELIGLRRSVTEAVRDINNLKGVTS